MTCEEMGLIGNVNENKEQCTLVPSYKHGSKKLASSYLHGGA